MSYCGLMFMTYSHCGLAVACPFRNDSLSLFAYYPFRSASITAQWPFLPLDGRRRRGCFQEGRVKSSRQRIV